MQGASLFRTRDTVSYVRVCISKKGRISALVALKSVTPPSTPEVDGHTCPRHLTVNPLTTAALFEAEQMDCWSVVSVCGLEMMASIPSLTKKCYERWGGRYSREPVKTDGELAEQSTGPQPLRIAHASRYCVMLGVASTRK